MSEGEDNRLFTSDSLKRSMKSGGRSYLRRVCELKQATVLALFMIVDHKPAFLTGAWLCSDDAQ